MGRYLVHGISFVSIRVQARCLYEGPIFWIEFRRGRALLEGPNRVYKEVVLGVVYLQPSWSR